MDVVLQALLDILNVGVIQVLYQPLGTAALIKEHHLAPAHVINIITGRAAHARQHQESIRKILHIIQSQTLSLVVGIHQGNDSLKIASVLPVVGVLHYRNIIKVMGLRLAYRPHGTAIILVMCHSPPVIHIHILTVLITAHIINAVMPDSIHNAFFKGCIADQYNFLGRYGSKPHLRFLVSIKQFIGIALDTCLLRQLQIMCLFIVIGKYIQQHIQCLIVLCSGLVCHGLAKEKAGAHVGDVFTVIGHQLVVGRPAAALHLAHDVMPAQVIGHQHLFVCNIALMAEHDGLHITQRQHLLRCLYPHKPSAPFVMLPFRLLWAATSA